MASNAQLAHVWAQNRHASGDGSNFFFCGPTIYSFGRHFPIARFTDATAGGLPVVLFTIENGWGGYTGRHIGHARNALHGLNVEVIECLEPGTRDGRHNSRELSQEDQHAANVEDYGARYLDALKAAALARSRGPQHIERAEQLRQWCALYCEAFALDVPAWVTDEAPANLPEIRARAAKHAAEEKDRKRAKLAGDAAEWRAGGRAELPYAYPDTLLRLSRNGRHVETSRGASVPVSDARRLWRLVAQCVATATGLTTPPPVAVGAFELRSISREGCCIVGCHTLDYSESLAFAAAQGWPL